MTTHQEALEAARPPRELVWNEYHDEQGTPDRWDAETPFNTYYGIALLHDGYSVQHDYADVAKALQSLDGAKEAARADCIRRCTAYLATIAPANGLVEKLLHRQTIDLGDISAVRSYLDADSILHHEAADTITAQAAEIEQQRRLIDGIDEERRSALELCVQRNKEITALTARLSALEALLDKAVGDIASERQRQIAAEGWTPEHDDVEHDSGDLAAAGSAYALHAADMLNPYSQGDGRDLIPDFWPFSKKWWKPTDARRDLVKAGALIAAEIDRIDRAAAIQEARHA